MSNFVTSFKDGRRDPVSFFCGLFVFLISLITYLRTVQPTVPFWDCGEFIACASTLSVPHPPGTPLFVLLGKVFSIFPLGGEIAWRVNLISVVSSAFAVLMAYLIITWLIRKLYPDVNTIYKRAVVYIGGITGSLFMAFSRTYWGNAVEAEVYGTSMLIMLASIYLVFKWYDHRQDKAGEKYLILFSFLSLLALGIHMTSFLIVPFAFLFIITIDKKYRISFPFWITFLLINFVMINVTAFLVLAGLWITILCLYYYWDRIREGWIYTIFLPVALFFFLLSSGFSWIPILLYCLVGWSLLTLIVYKLHPGKRIWRISLLILLFSLIGFSVQLYTPVRSYSDPVIDMNNPETWDKVVNFLERKQYTHESMFERMFPRRGEWSNQFGVYPHMGFMGFFREQYSPVAWSILFVAFGLVGILFLIRQKWRLGTFMFLICLAGTVGLVLYMNFADGTRIDPLTGDGRLEVRNRDYFFTPGFVVFAMFIGIGISAVVHFIISYLHRKKVSEMIKKIVLAILALTVLLPVFAYTENYYYCDRSRNYLAYNYAENLLNSSRENGIIFTVGDNDTFPSWCLQYAYGIRTDVRVIVLSLLGADWHIIEQRDKFDVPITMNDNQIHALRTLIVGDTIYSIGNQMIDHIIDNTLVKSRHPDNWQELPLKFKDFLKIDPARRASDTTLYFDPPIQFTIAANPNVLKYKTKPMEMTPLDADMEGMVYNIRPIKTPYRVNVERTRDFFINKLNTSGVTDTTIYKDDNALMVAENYWRLMGRTANEMMREGAYDEAIDLNIKAVKLASDVPEAFRHLVKNLKQADRTYDVQHYIDSIDKAPREILYEKAVNSLSQLFNSDIVDIIRSLQPAPEQSLRDKIVASKLFEETQYLSYLRILENFTEEYPDNETLQSLLTKVNRDVLRNLPSTKLDSLNLTGILINTSRNNPEQRGR